MGPESNTLEIAIIGGMAAVIVAFITIGAMAVFRLGSRVDRLADRVDRMAEQLSAQIAETDSRLSAQIAQSHNELLAKITETESRLTAQIVQSHNELNDKMDRMVQELRAELIRHIEQAKAEILNAMVNHRHVELGGPPSFTVPPPLVASRPIPAAATAAREPDLEPAPAGDD